MKRKLLLFTLAGILSMGTLTSCGDPAPICEQATVISITNVDELTAAWNAGEGNRLLNFAIDECGPLTINQNGLINSGEVKITSSDTKVISITGRYLSAVSAGTATVTVAYKNSSHSVSFAIGKRTTAPNLLLMPLSDIFGADDTDGINGYITTGTVVRGAASATDFGDKGSYYVKDAAGTEYLISESTAEPDNFTYNLETQRFTLDTPSTWKSNDQTKDIKANDEITFVAFRSDDGTTKAVKAILLTANGNAVVNGKKTTAELLALPASTQFVYEVTGLIDGWYPTTNNPNPTNGTEYGNFYIKTEGAPDTDRILVYGATATADFLSFNTGTGKWAVSSNKRDFLTNTYTSTLGIGSEVTIIGYRLNYRDNKQFTGVIQVPPTPAGE